MSSWDHLDVALVQAAADIVPEKNRARLDELAPTGADLVVFPEAFARDFGPVDDDLAPDAEPLDGPFATELATVAAARRGTLVAGMFEATGTHPFNTLLATDGSAQRSYRKIH